MRRRGIAVWPTGKRARWGLRAYPAGLVAVGVVLAIPLIVGRSSGPASAASHEFHREFAVSHAPAPPPLLRRTGWTASADGQEIAEQDGRARNVLDGKRNTMWHTPWSPAKPPGFPHRLIIDTKSRHVISELQYTPRQDTARNGAIGRYEVYLSMSRTRWGAPVATGTFDDSAVVQSVAFASTPARFVMLKILSEAGSRGPWSSAAEINLRGAGGPLTARGCGASAVRRDICGARRPVSLRARQGSWSPIVGFPLVPVAAALLPGNRVLTWAANLPEDFGGTGQTATATLDLVKRTVSQRLVTETGHDMFCPGISMLPDGRLIVTGGDDAAKTSFYTPSTDSWSAGPPMNITRGYQSSVTLGDGRVFTIGGSWSGGRGGKNGEIYSDQGGWALGSGLPVAPILTNDAGGNYRSDNHAWLFATTGNAVFQAGPSRQMNYFSTVGSGGVAPAGTRGDDGDAMNGTATMYDAGRILTVGGAPDYEHGTATRNAFTIDIAGGPGTAPVVARTGSLAGARAFHNSVVLPDGKVLVIGGQRESIPFSDAGSQMVPELWSPVSGRFRAMAPMTIPRNYHSIALLLPDARVLSAGGGLCGDCAANHRDGQIFSPPYLFGPKGAPAARPAITAAPVSASAGERIAVTTDRPVTAFALVRFGTVTHTVNTDQRRISLATAPGTTHSLAIPADRGIVVPGPYMLFALDAKGVPSVAATIMIR